MAAGVTYDLVTVGEAMLRLWLPPGERLETAPSYQVTVAGTEANVAMAVARHGRSVAWLSRLPRSALGRRAATEIARHGVDVSHVTWTDRDRMGTFFVELSVPPRPASVVYDRADSAAARMTPADLDLSVIDGARIVHMTGITCALSGSARAVTEEVVRRARDAGATVVFDVNYRARLWTVSEARPVLEAVSELADVVITTREDAHHVFGLEGDAAECAATLRDHVGAATCIVTDGADGAAWQSESGSARLPGHPAAVVDRIGSGDAFAAGVILGLLNDDLAAGIERGLAMAAIKLGILGDQLVTSPDEIDAVMRRGGTRETDR